MAEPTFFLSNVNLIATAVLDGQAGGGGSPAGLEEDNLKDDDLGVIWRNTGTPVDNMALRANWATPIRASVFAVLATNLKPGDSVTICLSDDGGATWLVQQELELHVDPRLGYPADFKWASPEVFEFNFLEVRFNVPAESPTRDMLDVGGVWVGERYTPAHGVSYQSRPEIVDNSPVDFTRGQQGRVNARRPYRSVQCAFPALRESELLGRYGDAALNMYDIFMRNGARRTVLAGMLGDDAGMSLERNYIVNRTAVYGLLQPELQPQPFNANAGERIYSLSISVREVLGLDYSEG